MSLFDAPGTPADASSDAAEPLTGPVYVMSDEEARRALTDHAYDGLPARLREPMVAHVMRTVCPEHDFSIRLAAMRAILTVAEQVEVGDVRVRGRPAAGALGAWSVSESGARYEVLVDGLDPIRVSCACTDFARSSLALCVHSMAVLFSVRRRAWRERLRPSRRPMVRWDPVERLHGPPDRLARLRVTGTALPGTLGGAPSPILLATAKGRLTMIAALEDAIARGVVGREPAVSTVLREERARAAAKVEAASRAGATMRALDRLKRPLYPYQREGVIRFIEGGCTLLADDMGLGKTTQAIAGAHALFVTGRITRGLFVVPASLKTQWRREWLAVTDAPITLVEGTPDERAALYRSTQRGFLVVGYEQLLRDLPLVHASAPELVVLDEAQRIKNPATKSAVAVKSLSPRYRLALTGTPLENRLGELHSIVEFVDELALGPAWRLAARHMFEEGDAAEGVSGARELGALRARLAPVFVRRVRKEVLSQLPERTDTRVPVSMTGAQQVAHATRETSIAMLLHIARRRSLRLEEHQRLMRLFTEQRIICNGLAQLDFEETWPECEDEAPTEARLESLDMPKLAAFRALIEDVCVVQRRKVVVFSQWRRMLRLAEWAVRDVLEGAALRAGFFTGAESPKLRDKALVEFVDDPSLAALFLTDAGGVGLNLQRAASACIQLELPWNPAVMEQRISRIYRLGQERPIDAFHLVSEGGIESRIADVIGHKRALFTGLFEGTSDEIRFEGRASFVETLRTIVEPASVRIDEPIEVTTNPEPALVAVPAAPDGEPPPPSPEPPAPASAAVPSFQIDGSPSASTPLMISTRPDGGLSIDVPAELAGPLAGMLSALADALRARASP